ncbi:MAG: FHA domain-containing protein [Eubacterium sp.]|nr:FHA domain-containing protein [Eubacterium sp.]
MKKRLSILLAFAILCCMAPVRVSAAEEIRFDTSYTIVDGEDGYFIARDRAGNYGLLDEKGEEAIEFDYADMSFAEDTERYDYVIAKQGENWGILNYDGDVLVPFSYNQVGAYSDGHSMAAGYDGNKTFLYNEKGKEQKSSLSGNYSKVLTDTAFAGESDIRNDRDNKLIDLKEEGLLYEDNEKGTTSSVILGVGKDIAAQYYKAEGETFYNKLRVDRYIRIFNSDGDEKKIVTPKEQWAEDEDEVIDAKLILKKAVSDHSILIQMKMPKGKTSFKVIYDVENDRFSEKFKTVGPYTDNLAFATNMDGDLMIIDENGEKVAGDIGIDGYTRDETSLESKESRQAERAFMLFEKEGKYRLYSLLQKKEIEGAFKEVIFKDSGYVLLKDDDDKYAVMDRNGDLILGYGDYEKDTLDNGEMAFYSRDCVTIVKNSGEKYDVHAYSSGEKKSGGFVEEHKKLLIILAIVLAVLLILVIILVVVRNRKKQAEERLRQEKLLEEQRRKKEAMERRRAMRKDVPRNNPPRRVPADIESSIRSQQFYDGHAGQSAVQTVPSGYLKGIKGEYAGALIRIKSGESLRIGRSHEGNDLIINNSKVSRRHCVITYNGAQRTYNVVDYSSNGVYLVGGKRLPRNMDVVLQEGTVLCIGSEETLFELGNRH